MPQLLNISLGLRFTVWNYVMKLHRWLHHMDVQSGDGYLETLTPVVSLLEDRHIMKRHHKYVIMYDNV